MSNYHINPYTGESSICKAKTPDKCKFGTEHYNTLEEAQHAQDEMNYELSLLMYGDERGEYPPLNLNSKFAAVRAQMLLEGAEYDTSIREDCKIVKEAAIRAGNDLDYYYQDADLRPVVEEYLKTSVQLKNIAELVEIAKNSKEIYDTHRNELARRNTSQPRKISWSELSKSVNLPDEGGTVNLNDMTSPTKGFCFSPYPEHSLAIDGSLTPNEVRSHLEAYKNKHKKELSKPNHYLGFWRSPYDGKLYIDISIVTNDSKEARKLCKKYDQQAFFDLQTFTGIEVNREALSGQ